MACALPPSSVRTSNPTPAQSKPTLEAGKGWDQVDKILSRIQAPSFPPRDCVITDYGAVAGGEEDATTPIRKAIQACSELGGGRVVIPPGVFLTGAIHLKSYINLHVSEGATLRFSPDPAAYLPVVRTRWEGIECMNYSPLIYAFEVKDIAVTGKGTLDGSATEEGWWHWARRGSSGSSLSSHDAKSLNDMAERGVPVEDRVFGEGHYLRPSFIQPYRSRNILVEGVTILRSPMWEVHPVLSSNVTVRGLTIRTHGPNNDGCNPDSSRDVLIEDCLFDVGDDCIAIKSGRNDDGRRVGVPVENIIIRNSIMKDGHAGVAIGSEISGGARNIFIEGGRMDSPNLDRALRIKSNARRGGLIENVYMRNVEVGEVAEALLTIDLLYEEGPRGSNPPVVRNINIANVITRKSPRLFYIQGFEAATIDNIRVSDSQVLGVTHTDVVEHAGRIELNNVRIVPENVPRSRSSRVGVQ